MADNAGGGGGLMMAAIGGLLLYQCSKGPDKDEQSLIDELGVSEEMASDLIDNYGSAEDAIDDYQATYREPFDESAARDAAERELALKGYDYRYGCTDDCSGHEAGWQWRAGNGYSTLGNSNSFDEGGRAFDESLDDRVDEMRDEYESGEDPDY